MNYLASNKDYWEKGYNAPNVDHPVFRFYGKILKPDFPQLCLGGSNLLDFGSGQGAAVAYFVSRGFNARGVDVSEKDIGIAKIRYPDLADRMQVCSASPSDVSYYGFASGIDIVTAVQAFYYLSNKDFDVCIEKIYAAMNPGAVLFATMKSSKDDLYYTNSVEAHDGMRVSNFQTKRLNVKNVYMTYLDDEDGLKKKFSMFRPLHIGHYSSKFRSDEDAGTHFTFCGIK